MKTFLMSPTPTPPPVRSATRWHATWSARHRLLLALAMAALLCGLLVISGKAPLAHAQTTCLTVAPHILPQKDTIPTIEQLWITVGNGCATAAQNGSLHVTDSLKCNGNWLVGLDENLPFATLQVGQTITPFTIQAYNTGCPPGTGATGPVEERLHGDASATGPGGQAYAGSADTYYTFS